MNTKIIPLVLLTILLSSCKYNHTTTVEIRPDTVSLLRNPAMGWGIYVDNYVKDNKTFWQEMGDAPDKYCTFLYIRVLWSYMEPEEGKYAWNENENYKQLIAEARRRGLRLHFRVFYDSQDMKYDATPGFVKEAGAEGYLTKKGLWSPYMDDPVLQQKLANFIQAFAAEYDDPSFVDCIDAFNIGWWGEGHHVSLKNPEKYEEVALWITDTYGNVFQNVLPVINYHVEITEPILTKIIERNDYILRHDAFGSQWYGDFERSFARKEFPKRAILAESCYWFVGIEKGDRVHKDGTDDTERWRNDETHHYTSWRDVYLATYEEVKEARANTLDLREKTEVKSWLTEAPDVVHKFMINGGYRFTPVAVTYPEVIKNNEEFNISHTWVNTGFGVLPNNNKHWNYKYKPAFALINEQNEIHPVAIDTIAEPSHWLMDNIYPYQCTISVDSITPGKYKLAIAIINRNTGKPGIKLSAAESTLIDEWLVLGDVTAE